MNYIRAKNGRFWHIAGDHGGSVCGRVAAENAHNVIGTNGQMRYRVCTRCRNLAADDSQPLENGEPMSMDEALAVIRRLFEEKPIR